jgi:hypothetical protein
MNKHITAILSVAFALTVFSCQKKMETWSGQETIYFKNAQPDGSAVPADSIANTFAFSQPNVTSMLVPVPVAIMGTPSSVDRSYKVTILDSSTAATNKQFAFQNSSFTIKAGKITDTIWVKFMRTPEMQTQVLSLYLRLDANENFIPNLADNLDVNGNITVHKSIISLKISDILTKPTYWIDGYFGTFSRKKLLLICNINGVDPSLLNTPPPPNVGYVTFLAKFTQRWLNDQAAQGNPVFEDDGTTRMVMGPNAQ